MAGMRGAVFGVVALFFVISGSGSTLAVKWGDTLTVKDDSGTPHSFGHPYCQSLVMFSCEFLCLGIFLCQLLYKERVLGQKIEPGVDTTLPVNRLLFAAPAMCDLIASTTLFVALELTSASVYQMLRGATVLFTGLLSRLVLKRKFQLYQWVGIAGVVVGLACVGLASILVHADGEKTPPNPVLGNILVVAAQVVVAAQMVIEEKIFSKYKPVPMQFVGWEGLYGTAVILVVLLVFLAVPAGKRPDDIGIWAQQLGNDWRALVSALCMLLATPTFNVTGQAITKYMSGTTRMVLDTLRNIVVWVFSLWLFGEKFKWLQLVGFVILVGGTAVYKNLVEVPLACMRHREEDASPAPAEDTVARRALEEGDGTPAPTVSADLPYEELEHVN